MENDFFFSASETDRRDKKELRRQMFNFDDLENLFDVLRRQAVYLPMIANAAEYAYSPFSGRIILFVVEHGR